jgi:hypothetical protein
MPADTYSAQNRIAWVVGDFAIDWFIDAAHDGSPAERPLGAAHPVVPAGWRAYEAPGGALLTAQALREAATDIEVRTPLDAKDPKAALEALRPALTHSLCELADSAQGARGPDPSGIPATGTRRIARMRNQSRFAPGHSKEASAVKIASQTLRELPGHPHPVDFLIVDEAGWGCTASLTPLPALREGGCAVLKLSGRLDDPARLKLWQELKLPPCQTLLLVGADDLRHVGIDLSRRLSWNVTARDLADALDPAISRGSGAVLLRELTRLGTLLVRFDLDGVALIKLASDATPVIRLVCDPAGIEEEFARRYWREATRGIPSYTLGITAAFVARLAHGLPQAWRFEDLDAVAEAALFAARSTFLAGMIADENACSLGPDWGTAFTALETLDQQQKRAGGKPQIRVQMCVFDVHKSAGGSWQLRPSASGGSPASIADIARSFVLDGNRTLAMLPRLIAGKLVSADPAETESYRWIGDLMERHMILTDPPRPLCLAVFGGPGSGKSFGVKQVAELIGGERLVPQEVNVSQLTSLRDLTREFHSARDRVLEGKVPLVFFDEFDSKFGEQPLGWLRFFLAPMQDGLFSDEGRLHSLKRAVFVFAGGTKRRMRDFAPDDLSGPQHTILGVEGEDTTPDRHAELRAAKVPDFVSRLQGYLDILGPDQVDEGDLFWPLRRAVLLGSLFDRIAPRLRGNGIAAIAEPVVNALLQVKHYRHGARSIEALLRMSALQQDSERFDIAMLPPDSQINLHTDAKRFNELLRGTT